MAEDWLADVRRYVSGADEAVVTKIVNYLGIALRNRDSSLVSFSDPEEVSRVRERFLRKKLALTQSDDALNSGLDWVQGQMIGDRTKNRVTVYYLLAHYFGKLDLFGGPAGTSEASLAAVAESSSATSAPKSEHAAQIPDGTSTSFAPVAPERAANERGEETADTPFSSAAVAPVSAVPNTTGPYGADPRPPDGSRERAATRSYGTDRDDEKRISAWPQWLTWLLIALAVLALILLLQRWMS